MRKHQPLEKQKGEDPPGAGARPGRKGLPKRSGRKPKVSAPQEAPAETVVVANRFNVTEPDGKRRISLFVEEGNAMLALYDKDDNPRFLIAVTPDGSALMSAIEADSEKGVYGDSFRLVVSNGEAEIVMRDAIFKNVAMMSPRGFFASED